MPDLKRLTPTQLATWGVVIVASVIGGALLAFAGLQQLTEGPRSFQLQLPIGTILLVFGIAMTVIVVRQQRRFPRR
jgi:hypothetical protein